MENKDYIKERWRDVLDKLTDVSADGKGYVCPLCGHGAGGDGLILNKKSSTYSLKCFGPCGFSGDVIELYMRLRNTDFKQALKELSEMLGLPPEADSFQTKKNSPRNVEITSKGGNVNMNEKRPQKAKDYTRYYDECAARLDDTRATDYIKSRGISVETCRKLGVGFDPAADPAGSGNPTPRLIFPCTKYYYSNRAITPGVKPKTVNPKDAPVSLFNIKKALEADRVFITEGIFSALSIIDAGENAIALNGVSNKTKLISILEGMDIPKSKLFILALDNDDAGKEAAEWLSNKFRKLKLSYRTVDLFIPTKKKSDPNDLLQADTAAFLKKVAVASEFKPHSAAVYMDFYMQEEKKKYSAAAATGFPDLDKKSGGLHEGLYVVAAISSLGKTTFIHQMCDQIAAQGRDVIFFSLEQSTLELVSKSLARLTAKALYKPSLNDYAYISMLKNKKAPTSLQIRKEWESEQLERAITLYRDEIAERISIVEGNFNTDVFAVCDYVKAYADLNDAKPIVVIDYLQILQPPADLVKKSTKEIMDLTISELKRVSRSLGVTIIVISSVNRMNYETPIDLVSLKESGGIEYTADVVWGLQLHVVTSPPEYKGSGKAKDQRPSMRELIKHAKKRNPRLIDLVCLKNRYGISNYECSFKYFPAYDFFVENLTTTEFSEETGFFVPPEEPPQAETMQFEGGFISFDDGKEG